MTRVVASIAHRTGWTVEYILDHTLAWIRVMNENLEFAAMEAERTAAYFHRMEMKALQGLKFEARKTDAPKQGGSSLRQFEGFARKVHGFGVKTKQKGKQ